MRSHSGARRKEVTKKNLLTHFTHARFPIFSVALSHFISREWNPTSCQPRNPRRSLGNKQTRCSAAIARNKLSWETEYSRPMSLKMIRLQKDALPQNLLHLLGRPYNFVVVIRMNARREQGLKRSSSSRHQLKKHAFVPASSSFATLFRYVNIITISIE